VDRPYRSFEFKRRTADAGQPCLGGHAERILPNNRRTACSDNPRGPGSA
jgi:hypothetical protein